MERVGMNLCSYQIKHDDGIKVSRTFIQMTQAGSHSREGNRKETIIDADY
jgi:hypothetical protein